MSSIPINISKDLFERLRNRANEANRSPDELAEALLRQELEPPHPYIAVETGRFGVRATVKGTRIGVATLVAYTRLGYSPERIAAEILPHLTLAQVFDALSYYHDHQEEIEREIGEDSETLWMQRLRALAGSSEVYAQMTGGRAAPNG